MPFISIQQKGFFINLNESSSSDINNYFCGRHAIEGAICPNCGKPLLRFFTFSKQDIPTDIGAYPYQNIHFLFCWKCNISQDYFFYKVLGDNEISIIKYKKGGVQKDFPYFDYPDYFPLGEVQFEKIADRDQKIISNVNSKIVNKYDLPEEDFHLCCPRHQIGGEPYLVQEEYEKIYCPICKKAMLFTISVSDNCLDQRGFVGNPFVQILYYFCGDCLIICAIQRCD